MALYIERDFFHKQATQLADRIRAPIPYTWLSERELQNSVRRSLARREISSPEHDSIFRQIAEDEYQGILTRQAIPQSEHHAQALELSKRYTSRFSSRSLDILQVAAALLLKASTFASFDLRQRELAAANGMQVIPRQLIKSRPPG